MSSRRRAPAAPSWRVPDTVPPAAPAHDDWDWAGTVGRSTRTQAMATLGVRAGLWTALALALVLGLVNCAAPGTGPAAPVGEPEPAEPVAPPGGCAELVVAAWLAGDADLLAGVVGMPRAAPEPRRRAVHTYLAAATPVGVAGGPRDAEAGWTYLVGAQVEVRPEEADDAEPVVWDDAGVQFFAVTLVPVVGGCQGWAPAALPAQVAAPSLASPGSEYSVSLRASDTDLAETLAAFFAGMLAGEGNPERYMAPGTAVELPQPPPYQQVTVSEVRTVPGAPVERGGPVPGDGTQVPLLVTVEVGDGELPLVYPVTVGVRDGRWEVVLLDLFQTATGG